MTTDLPDLPEALCAQSDPEAWFPELGSTNRYAIKVCHRCPARAECLTWAINTGQQHGIWGGTTPHERATIRRQLVYI
jgi:WhiB family redox-sensing transcriptional regulator